MHCSMPLLLERKLAIQGDGILHYEGESSSYYVSPKRKWSLIIVCAHEDTWNFPDLQNWSASIILGALPVLGTGTRMTYSSSNLLLLVLQSSSREYDCTVLYLQSPHTKGFVQSNLSVVHLRSMTLYPCALAQIFESRSSQNVRGLSTCEKD